MAKVTDEKGWSLTTRSTRRLIDSEVCRLSIFRIEREFRVDDHCSSPNP